MQTQISGSLQRMRWLGWRRSALAVMLAAAWLLPANVPFAAAADTWTPRPSGTTSDLRGVAVADNTTAWVVGSGGTILKTSNGGATWAPQQSGGITDDLLSVGALDAQTAWIVGAGGTILKTTNGGTDWSRQSSYPDAYLVSVAAVDANTAWTVDAGSGTILKTSDGGNTWDTQYEYGYPLSAVAASDADTAWAVGQAGAVLYTTDGGQTWNPWWCNDCHYLSGVAAASRDTLWTVGRTGIIGRSTDGGQTWGVQNSGTPNDLTAVTTADAATAWVVGMNGTILKTTDGGGSWSLQSSGGPALRGVAASGTGTAYAVGDGGAILQTGVAPVQPTTQVTPSPTATGPAASPPVGEPGKWNGTVTIVQKFTWQGSASAGIENYAGDASLQLTTRVVFKDSVASLDTTLSGGTHYTTNGTGSPCSYEITRTETGSASLSAPLEATLSQPSADRLALNIVVLPDPTGTVDVEEVSRNYGGESCFTEVDRRQYAFGSNNTYVDSFYRELEFELEHGTLQTSVALNPAGPGGAPLFTASETSSTAVPMARPVGMPNITKPGQETMTVTWSLQATPKN